MVSFFEPSPPREPASQPAPVPEWLEEPRGWIGGVVGARIALATTSDVAVLVHSLYAFPTGMSLTVELRGRDERATRNPHRDFHKILHAEYVEGELSPVFFRFGIELADGGKATNLVGAEERRSIRDRDEPPSAPVLSQRGGSGSGSDVEIRYWLWPLPTGERISFVCEWPAFEVPISRADIDAAQITEAAPRARRLIASME
jgi:hypothetical protein